ncbi:hypothetical protein llap_11890 [Limosa lapponica baueri]|uniref:Uncharacterized protein n=1 Tax=Limosa lapponica baueri TaxID=1758121 RepID=A0A2I0TVH6_LIMLA|nr:hypothetical protein llap_11890 [Limosa lapponica baueri]
MGVRIHERNSPIDTKVSEERGGDGAPGTRAKIPLKPMKDHSGTNIHAATHGGPHAGTGGYVLKEAVAHGKSISERAPDRNWGLLGAAHAGTGFLAGLVTCGRPILEQSVPEGLHPMERTHARAVLEELQLMGRTHIGEFQEGLSPFQETLDWSRGRM